MLSYTVAADWPLHPRMPDETTFSVLSLRPRAQPQQHAVDEGGTSSLVDEFVDLLRDISGREPEITTSEAESDGGAKDSQIRQATDEAATDSGTPSDEVSRCAADRIHLLARSYVSGSSPETEARLAILTERLRVILPPVTEGDWAALSEVAENIAAASNRHEEIRKRLGLK